MYKHKDDQIEQIDKKPIDVLDLLAWLLRAPILERFTYVNHFAFVSEREQLATFYI